MAKIINITDKFSKDKPVIEIGKKKYEVNTGLSAVLKFEELQSNLSPQSITAAIEIALGEQAAKDLDVSNMPMSNIKVITVAILAAMQDIEYDEAEKRFQRAMPQ